MLPRFHLESALGFNSQPMKAINEMVASRIVTYNQMSELSQPGDGPQSAMSTSANRVPAQTEQVPVKPEFLARVVLLSKVSSLYHGSALRQIEMFDDVYKGTSITFPQMIKMAERGVKLGDLSWLINNQTSAESRSSLIQLIEKLASENASKQQLNMNRVDALNYFNTTFGADSSTMRKLLVAENHSMLLPGLLAFLKEDPAHRGEFLKRQIDKDASPETLDPLRLRNIDTLESAFGKDSPYFKKIQDIVEAGFGVRYQELATFIDPSNHSKKLQSNDVGKPTAEKLRADLAADYPAKTLLKKFLDENVEPKKLSYSYLNARLKLNEYLGEDSPILKRLLDLEPQGLNLINIKEFIDEDHIGNKSLVQRLVNSGATPKELGTSRLRGLAILVSKVQLDEDSFQHLLSLEKEGLNIDKLAKYVQADSKVRSAQIQALLSEHAPISVLNIKRLADAALLAKTTKYFTDPSTIKYLTQLQLDGLSANRLMRFIEDAPASRPELVNKLVAENADVKRFNKQMSFSLFPDDVSYAILDRSAKDGSSTATLMGALRNWKHGEEMYRATIDWIRDGNDPDVSSLMNLNKSVVDGYQTTSENQAATHEALRSRSDRGEGISSILKSAVEGIDKQIPKDKPIVLLGRDNWQLLPMLREQGRPVQYFLWSRLQGADVNTMNQWLKEVPPNSAVIDTGYSGSIINWIRNIDPSADGYLLSSSGKYPQLLSGLTAGRVKEIEYFPKLIGRSSTYTNDGGAVSKSKNRDGDEQKSKKDFNHRWFVQGANSDMLRAAGLSEWKIWRYSEYVGLTPKERLLLDTEGEVTNHYSDIKAQREQSTSNKTPARSTVEPTYNESSTAKNVNYDYWEYKSESAHANI